MSRDIIHDPKTTPSILASIPDCLKRVLVESFEKREQRRSILISSNSLTNRFILERWGIRPSQRKRFKNLFATIRKECRGIFTNYLARGNIDWKSGDEIYTFGVFRFDEIRGNLILGFVKLTPEENWRIPIRRTG